MLQGIKAIFFDIGGTLVTKANYPRRDLTVIAQMVALLGEKCTPLELEGRILEGDAQYKTWRSRTFIELSPEDRWARFLLTRSARGSGEAACSPVTNTVERVSRR